MNYRKPTPKVKKPRTNIQDPATRQELDSLSNQMATVSEARFYQGKVVWASGNKYEIQLYTKRSSASVDDAQYVEGTILPITDNQATRRYAVGDWVRLDYANGDWQLSESAGMFSIVAPRETTLQSATATDLDFRGNPFDYYSGVVCPTAVPPYTGYNVLQAGSAGLASQGYIKVRVKSAVGGAYVDRFIEIWG